MFINMFLGSGLLAQASVPEGVAVTLPELVDIFENFAGFLMVAGGVLAAIVIIGSGIYYLMAGPDSTKVKAARDMLKAGIIGSFIIFGFGLIVNTIKLLAEDPFSFFR